MVDNENKIFTLKRIVWIHSYTDRYRTLDKLKGYCGLKLSVGTMKICNLW